MGLDIIVAKIVFAFVFAVFLVFIGSPFISVIGMISCPNCDPFLNAIFFIVVPISAVFIGIYKIIGIFSRSNRS